MVSPEWLYRGVSLEMHQKNGGRLQPKATTAFAHEFNWGDAGRRWGDGGTWGTSQQNAILQHQLDQRGLPTSGISTTPFLQRARFYATRGGDVEGVVYKISTTELLRLSVRVFRVADSVPQPSVPEDDEFILVAADWAAISSEVIGEVIRVGSA